MPNTEVKPSVQPVGRSVSVSFCRTFASTSRPCCTCRCTQSPANNSMLQLDGTKKHQRISTPKTSNPTCIHPNSPIFLSCSIFFPKISKPFSTILHHFFPFSPCFTAAVPRHPPCPRLPAAFHVRGGPRHVRLQGIEGRGLVLRSRGLAACGSSGDSADTPRRDNYGLTYLIIATQLFMDES